MEIRLRNGTVLDGHCETMLASPTRRLLRAQYPGQILALLELCRGAAGEAAAVALIVRVDNLEKVADIRELVCPLGT